MTQRITATFENGVLKPTQPGLDTTLTVGTNRRPYYVRLVSTSMGASEATAWPWKFEPDVASSTLM